MYSLDDTLYKAYSRVVAIMHKQKQVQFLCTGLYSCYSGLHHMSHPQIRVVAIPSLILKVLASKFPQLLLTQSGAVLGGFPETPFGVD